MSTSMLHFAAARAAAQRAFVTGERSAYYIRLCKIICAVVLGVCFWYSVPYYLPLKLDPDPMKAAANEAAAYEGNFSRQLAMPAILAVSAYMLWRLPKRGRFTRAPIAHSATWDGQWPAVPGASILLLRKNALLFF